MPFTAFLAISQGIVHVYGVYGKYCTFRFCNMQ